MTLFTVVNCDCPIDFSKYIGGLCYQVADYNKAVKIGVVPDKIGNLISFVESWYYSAYRADWVEYGDFGMHDGVLYVYFQSFIIAKVYSVEINIL